MILVGDQAIQFAEEVEPHQGHELHISLYNDIDVAIECLTCAMVLIDADLSLEDNLD